MRFLQYQEIQLVLPLIIGGVAGAAAVAGVLGAARSIGLTDVIESAVTPGGTGNQQTGDTSLGQSEYDFNYRAFPNDLVNDTNAHYMVININVPAKKDGQVRTKYQGAQYNTSDLPGDTSKLNVARSGKLQGGQPLPPGALSGSLLTLPRYSKRIKESIAIFMPGSILYGQQNQYEEISMTAIAGNVGKAGLQYATAALSGLASGALGKAVGRASGSATAINALGQSIGTIASITQNPINPRVEVLFSTTNQRQFVFEFLMAPRNEQESKTIEQIVRTLRFHAVPELNSSTGGLTFIPPAEFDITFFHKGVENVKIPRINTCVLNRIDVDYSPQGVYSTFKNGYPVAVRLSLAFTEIEMLHKARIVQGF
jgi:hypothetical protein